MTDLPIPNTPTQGCNYSKALTYDHAGRIQYNGVDPISWTRSVLYRVFNVRSRRSANRYVHGARNVGSIEALTTFAKVDSGQS